MEQRASLSLNVSFLYCVDCYMLMLRTDRVVEPQAESSNKIDLRKFKAENISPCLKF